MVKVGALNGTFKAFAKAAEKLATQNKEFAEELVYECGIRGKITPKALKPLTGDIFDCTGKLTSQGKTELKKALKDYKLPQDATWYEILKAREENAIRIVEIDI